MLFPASRLSGRELLIALYGAWRLARLDAAAVSLFPNTVEGFWKSFYAALLVAPFYVVMLWTTMGSLDLDTDPLRYALIHLLAYVIGWFAYPLLMVDLSRLIGRPQHYLRYVSAYNWFHVLQMTVVFPVSVAANLGVVPETAAVALGIPLLAAILMYNWFIARSALEIDGHTAAGVVFVDLLLSLLINGVADSMA